MNLARFVALLALVLTIVPPVLFALGRMEDSLMKGLLVAGSILWFAAAPKALRGGTE